MLDTLFLQILDMTKVASIVILVVLLVRFCLKRAPKVFSYVLWAVVLFRLLCPVSIEAPISLIPEVGETSTEEVNTVLPNIEFETIQDREHNKLSFNLDDTQTVQVHTAHEAEPTLYLSIAWLGGVIVMLVYSAVSLVRLHRKLSASVKLRDNIYIADYIDSPFVMGLICPKIYLPSSLDEKECGCIILHEQNHIRRGDHVVKLLSFAALCLHWFNPLVWVAFILSGKDMEMSCDEAVLKKLGSDIRADYSASLISLATGRRIIAGTPLAFGEGDTEGRIKNIAKWKKPAVWVIVIAVVLCTVVAVCLVTDPIKQDDTQDTVMSPTTANITGAFDSYLYVPIDGATYRFERIYDDPASVTKGSMIHSFTEKAEPQNVYWRVYDVEEYPDRLVVLAEAGADYVQLYKYSPSKAVDPDELTAAKASGAVTVEDGDVTFGEELWEEFYAKTQEGTPASVTVAHYHTLESDNCGETYYEVYKEDYPSLFTFVLTFDGETYTLSWNEYGTSYVRWYSYLRRFETIEPSYLSSKEATPVIRYVLTSDADATWEDLIHGLYSSQLGDYIDHYTIYTDRG